MPTRRASLILQLLALPALIGCGGSEAPPRPVPSEHALAAVAENPGLPRETLARAVDALFMDETVGETRAVVVLKDGRIVAERYGEGFGRDTLQLGRSMAGGITGVMIGQLVADGRLRLDETAPVPAWQRPGDPRGDITLRQLLQMRSGLRHAEAADRGKRSDAMRMLFLDGRDDMAAYAEAQPLEANPGRRFEYSTATSVILADVAARALTESRNPVIRRNAAAYYLRTRLFEPAGMHSAVPEFDPAGTFIGGAMVHATARDWAKFGELLRNGGAVKGAQLVPRGWIEFMTRPSPRNHGYGAQLWLNHRQSKGGEVLFPDRGQAGLFACIGELGQYVIVSPAQKLTIVRLGRTEDEDRAALLARLGDLVELFPQS